MIKKFLGVLSLVFFCVLFLCIANVNAEVVKVKLYYGDINLSDFEKMPGSWNLNAGDLIITYTLDLVEAPNIAYTGNWGQMGIVGIFSPDWSGARMCGFLYDGANSSEIFPFYELLSLIYLI